MRMRKKKNLEARLEQCSTLRIDSAAETPPDWQDIFGNDHPLMLEIGCGKGQFIAELAARHPELNFIALERVSNVAVMAMERVLAARLPNVRFLIMNADHLPNLFEAESISRIYLNFSCPFPKNKQRKHRLTHPRFLTLYRDALLPGGEIHLKTDSACLFEFSLNTLCGQDFKLKNITFDLHNSGFDENIMTEYETRFAEQGCPIYRLEAVRPGTALHA